MFTVTVEHIRFTCTTTLSQQLPILDGLPSSTRVRNNRPSSRQQLSSPLTTSTLPSSFSPSSDSSDSEKGAYIHLNHRSTMSVLATVEPTSVKAPVLTEGDISPTVMMDFENTTLDFFVSKSVPADKQVTMIIPGIKDLHIRDWISTDCACLVELPFSDFMKEMQVNYLHQDWEDQIRNQILTSTLLSSKVSFWNWSQQLLKLNCLLHGTPSVFDHATLHNHLEAHLNEELRACLKHNEAHKDKVLKTWINSICLIDEAHAVETKRHCELIEETLDCQAKHQNTKNDTLCGPSHCGNNTQTTGSSSSTSYVKLPPLLDAKQTLLNKHDGCTKCCHFYVDHQSQNCPDSFPSGKMYKTVTLTNALTAKKAKATTKHSKSMTTKPVAATSSATIEAVDSNEDISATTAILPDFPSKYTSDSDEDWDISCCEVSHTPLCSKHLIWNCQIHSQMDDFPVKTCALLDNSAHLVLIQPDLVDCLGLKQYQLHVLEVIDVAFSKEKNKTELYFYVRLSLLSLDCTWTPCVMKAIVTPGLCLPVILGLLWLEKNFIVTDHAA